MIPELEKPRVTEIHVRMDCNGCVQKIKKALHGINGIYDHYIDFPQQKITIIGWADPEKIIKAIKKTRKMATIFTHTEPTDPPAQPTDPAPESAAPAPDAANPPPPAEAAPPAEVAPPAEAAPQVEPPKDPPPPENPPPDATPSSAANDNSAGQAGQSSGPKDVEEVHVVYHHPPDYGHRFRYGHNYGHGYGHIYGHGYGGHWNNYPNGPGFRHEPPSGFRHEPPSGFRHEPPSGFQHEPPLGFRHKQPPPDYVTHSYNTYKPSPYVTEYEYIQSPPRHTYYSRPEGYSDDHRNNGNGNISSMFSDENPNACRIV